MRPPVASLPTPKAESPAARALGFMSLFSETHFRRSCFPPATAQEGNRQRRFQCPQYPDSGLFRQQKTCTPERPAYTQPRPHFAARFWGPNARPSGPHRLAAFLLRFSQIDAPGSLLLRSEGLVRLGSRIGVRASNAGAGDRHEKLAFPAPVGYASGTVGRNFPPS